MISFKGSTSELYKVFYFYVILSKQLNYYGKKMYKDYFGLTGH